MDRDCGFFLCIFASLVLQFGNYFCDIWRCGMICVAASTARRGEIYCRSIVYVKDLCAISLLLRLTLYRFYFSDSTCSRSRVQREIGRIREPFGICLALSARGSSFDNGTLGTPISAVSSRSDVHLHVQVGAGLLMATRFIGFN